MARFPIPFDVIVLTECWLDEDTLIPQIQSYTSYNTTKYVNQNSVVVVYIRDTLTANVSEPDIKDANCLQLDLSNGVTIFDIYRSPSFKNVNNFLILLGLEYE